MTRASPQRPKLGTRSDPPLYHTGRIWAAESHHLCQQAEHMGWKPLWTCTTSIKVCLQPRLFIHFVWFGKGVAALGLLLFPIWHNALCLRHQRFAAWHWCASARLGSSNQTWRRRRRRYEGKGKREETEKMLCNEAPVPSESAEDHSTAENNGNGGLKLSGMKMHQIHYSFTFGR